MARLPPELIDYIIDYLHGDKDTLLQLSLVCHAVVPSARYHLFDRLKISNSNVTALSTLVTKEAPEIALYVRELTLEAGDGWSVFRELRDILDGKELCTLLRMFLLVIAPRTQNVVKLVFQAVPLEGDLVGMLTPCFPKLSALSLFNCAFRSTADLDKLVRDHPTIHTVRAHRVCSVGGLTSPCPGDVVERRHVLRQLKVTEGPSPCPHTLVPWLVTHCNPNHFVYTLYCLEGFYQVNNAIIDMDFLRHLHLIMCRWGREGKHISPSRSSASALTEASPSKVSLMSPYQSLAITTMTLDGTMHMLNLVVTILAELDPPSFVFLRVVNLRVHLEETEVNKVEAITWAGMDQTLSVLLSLGAVNFYRNPCQAVKHIHVSMGAIEARLPILHTRQMLRLQEALL
ncbi:hypothetical protein C8T65DRAFT_590472 [Cerioporus squamosus]|nr:hypothetical protein C8T65DRAFT_590472 [Cerioporus squamosus]